MEEENQHERNLKLWGGYTAFVAALLVATMGMGKDYSRAWVIISLLALSLPSLVAYMLLDFTVRVKQRRKKACIAVLRFFSASFPVWLVPPC
jgi:hypothetical protein